VTKFKYLGTTTLTNQNDIHDEIRSRLNSENACYYSVQNLLSSCLISKNLKIKIYKTVILLIVLYGCETWSLTLGQEHKLRVFENRVLRKVFRPKRKEDGHGENCIMMNFAACILHRILLRWLNQRGWGGLDMWHAWGRGEVFTGFW
jgi:hypothetical protein